MPRAGTVFLDWFVRLVVMGGGRALAPAVAHRVHVSCAIAVLTHVRHTCLQYT